jgi:hypothetical protein
MVQELAKSGSSKRPTSDRYARVVFVVHDRRLPLAATLILRPVASPSLPPGREQEQRKSVSPLLPPRREQQQMKLASARSAHHPGEQRC